MKLARTFEVARGRVDLQGRTLFTPSSSSPFRFISLLHAVHTFLLLLVNIDDCQAANGITLVFVRLSMHGLRLSSWNWNHKQDLETAKHAVLCTAAEFFLQLERIWQTHSTIITINI